ncbi:homoserine O-acetyltransferase [Variovorax paradoxus]|uniref:alpha/beta fold hydrolase n=1 Tax=Variovorax paradoxus TaxID=34073 RepID=UPI002781F1E3|nr:alpha/beta fold hydrolase [Variovorax paradoxus]MDP9962894.1 homoserine O-acetyltransferase [Variovorax paradoxus]
MAYVTYGELAPDGRNAILATHGYTASHLMLAHGAGTAEGSWAPLIGPGKPLDTDKYFIVCSNMLGSSYGTTGPGSIDPASGVAYGADYPDITLTDIVEVQHRLLSRLGVRHLKCVVGPSFGGFQALQWALDHPDWVDSIGVVVSAPYLPASEYSSLESLQAELATNAQWNNGRCASLDTMVETLEQMRLSTMDTYGMSAVLAARGFDAEECAARCRLMSATWAREFNPYSLLVLMKAALAFDVRDRLDEIRADVLYVVADTDKLFPPDPTVQTAMGRTRGRRPMHYVQMRTDFGHSASGAGHALWSESLRDLLHHA